jgi:cell division protein FtsB
MIVVPFVPLYVVDIARQRAAFRHERRRRPPALPTLVVAAAIVGFAVLAIVAAATLGAIR